MLVFTVNPLTNAENKDQIPEWGIYVYMAGDNSLYEEVDDDLNEMKMVGSNSDLEIVALTNQVQQDDSSEPITVTTVLEVSGTFLPGYGNQGESMGLHPTPSRTPAKTRGV